MTTTITSSRTGNGLSLLANKCAARTFDISSGMVYASMRDQIVRAQLLIRDLRKCDPSARRILIVGAGIAGISAAACAESLGIEARVVESNSIPIHLQNNVRKRMVGPFMYEWPSILSNSQSYPPTQNKLGEVIDFTPTWNSTMPISAHDLANDIVSWCTSLSTPLPYRMFHYGCVAAETKQYVRDFVAAHSLLRAAGANVKSPLITLSDKTNFEPDYVILAVGMGTERTHLIEGTENDPASVRGVPFWQDDDLRNTPNMDWQVGVFGGGDGALQDVLRLITNFDHPLQFIDALNSGKDNITKQLNKIMGQLEALEQQSRLYATWSSGSIYDLIDLECERICKTISSDNKVVQKVLAQIRNGEGTTTLVHRGTHFGKAYLLNRFCLHLIEKCLPPIRITGKVGYLRIQNAQADRARTELSGVHVVELDNGKIIRLDKVVVRFGPKQSELQERQLVKLHPETQADRTSMASIPLPFTVAE